MDNFRRTTDKNGRFLYWRITVGWRRVRVAKDNVPTHILENFNQEDIKLALLNQEAERLNKIKPEAQKQKRNIGLMHAEKHKQALKARQLKKWRAYYKNYLTG